MGRKRYISTEISIDTKLTSVSELAALLYTWMIPHAGDNCRLSAKNAGELKLSVMPGSARSVAEIEAAVGELMAAELIGRLDNGVYYFPAENFYKYQTYIKPGNRAATPPINAANQRKSPGIAEDQRASAEIAGDRRETPESTASPSLSLPLSLSFLKAGRPEAPADSNQENIAEVVLAEDAPKPWHATFAEIYQSDQRRFALLYGWCVAAENKGYAGARVADALAEFQRYDAKSKIDSWAKYLDALIDRRTARVNAREFEAGHEAIKNAPVPDWIANLARGVANA